VTITNSTYIKKKTINRLNSLNITKIKTLEIQISHM